MIKFRMNEDKAGGTINKDGQPIGAFWQNSDRRWSVRVDGFPVAVIPTRSAIGAFVHSTLAD